MLDHTLHLSLDDDRHLVIGDVHGRWDMFQQALDLANYDPAKDIIYSVGDMIDRGPDSVKVVEFFQQERCYAVKGNHELMMMDIDWFSTWIENGGLQCMDDLHRNGWDHELLKRTISPLPWVIDVGDNDDEHAFRVLHAEMPPGWSDEYFINILNTALNTDDPGFGHLVWSRKLVQEAKLNVANMRPPQTGIKFHPDRYRNVFAGHTPIQNAMRCGDHWFIDTWASRTLTLIDAVTFEKYVSHI